MQKMVVSLLVGSLAVTSGFGKNLNKTSTDISSSANPAAYGQWVTYTATVTSAGGTPTGTVTFKHGNTTLGAATLNASGQATFSTTCPLAIACTEVRWSCHSSTPPSHRRAARRPASHSACPCSAKTSRWPAAWVRRRW